MVMKHFLSAAIVTILISGLVIPGIADERPNFLVVLADDLGYGDLGCYGEPDVHTPNLDQFAEEGVRLTHCYSAAANCSPSRTGLMTGRNPFRVGIHNWIPMLSPMHVKAEEITVATLLRDAGYSTCHSGKWHLNGNFNLPGQPQPDDHGFDHWFSTQNNALPNHRNPWNFVRNDIPVGPQEGYAADLVAAEAIDWLRNGRKKEQPFFLFVCFHEPHEPIASAPEHSERYAKFEDPAQRAYLGNITQLDAAFGRLIEELDIQGLSDDTLVFFTSDNGPALTGYHPYGSTGGLRAKKGHLYEGGIRVPGIFRWPGKLPVGKVVDVPVSGVDLLPTLCEIAGVDLPSDRAIDGTSLVPLAKGESLNRKKPLYWHFLRSSSDVKVALRDGPWKLCASVSGFDFVGRPDITAEENAANKNAQLAEFSLYHLVDDPAEEVDRKGDEEERFAALKTEMEKLFAEVSAESPEWPEWEWPRYEGQRIEWPAYKAKKRKNAQAK